MAANTLSTKRHLQLRLARRAFPLQHRHSRAWPQSASCSSHGTSDPVNATRAFGRAAAGLVAEPRGEAFQRCAARRSGAVPGLLILFAAILAGVDPHAAGAAAQPEERTEMQVSVDEAVSAQPAVESVMAAAAAASTAVSTPDPAAAPQAPAASPPGGIDINSATAAELAAGLNGVGASRAEAIVRYREQFGPFESIEELVEVGGIGPATVERNRALLRLR